MLSIWNILFRTGTIANSIKRQISFFIQSRFLSCKYAITPVIPNRGSHPATEAHLQFDSGVKVGIAGISAGKKNASTDSQ